MRSSDLKEVMNNGATSPCKFPTSQRALFWKWAAATAVAALLAGCGGSLLESQKIDYKSAGKLPSLEIPPDLTAPTRDERYTVPDIAPGGTATYSTYSSERAGAPRTGGPVELLPSIEKVRVERAGNQRWLVVPESPEKVWPMVK